LAFLYIYTRTSVHSLFSNLHAFKTVQAVGSPVLPFLFSPSGAQPSMPCCLHLPTSLLQRGSSSLLLSHRASSHLRLRTPRRLARLPQSSFTRCRTRTRTTRTPRRHKLVKRRLIRILPPLPPVPLARRPKHLCRLQLGRIHHHNLRHLRSRLRKFRQLKLVKHRTLVPLDRTRVRADEHAHHARSLVCVDVAHGRAPLQALRGVGLVDLVPELVVLYEVVERGAGRLFDVRLHDEVFHLQRAGLGLWRAAVEEDALAGGGVELLFVGVGEGHEFGGDDDVGANAGGGGGGGKCEGKGKEQEE
ncbi:hypothetical protein P167DRAFT_590688, partial [Morchella conica CCBAS932]